MATKAIGGEKVWMTQICDSQARLVPVTVAKIDPCRIVQVKTPESDGYNALQATFGSREAPKLPRPEAAHFAKAGVAPGVRLVELRLEDVGSYEVGQELSVETFADRVVVDVTAVSKGRGFTG